VTTSSPVNTPAPLQAVKTPWLPLEILSAINCDSSSTLKLEIKDDPCFKSAVNVTRYTTSDSQLGPVLSSLRESVSNLTRQANKEEFAKLITFLVTLLKQLGDRNQTVSEAKLALSQYTPEENWCKDTSTLRSLKSDSVYKAAKRLSQYADNYNRNDTTARALFDLKSAVEEFEKLAEMRIEEATSEKCKDIVEVHIKMTKALKAVVNESDVKPAPQSQTGSIIAYILLVACGLGIVLGLLFCCARS